MADDNKQGGKHADTDAFVKGAYALDGTEAAKAFYSEWSDAYEDRMVGDLGYVGPDRISRMLAAHLEDVSTPVLDIGCGTGLTSVHLAEQGFRAIDGIDITPAMLERAKARGIYRKLIRADLNEPLALDDGSYGAAVSSGTFTCGHVGPEPLPEIMRVLRSGGLMAITIHKDLWEARGFKAMLDRFENDAAIALIEHLLDEVFRGEGPAVHYLVYRKA
ncbi:MAG: class I SAM-dependent methyltransferase [Pseudomonadota bacterium]